MDRKPSPVGGQNELQPNRPYAASSFWIVPSIASGFSVGA
jgi:hypothetical protein